MKRNGRLPTLPPIANSASEGGIRRSLPALANDLKEGISSRLSERVDILEQASSGVQRELVQLRADVRTSWNENEMNINALRREMEALKESLQMKEEALEALTKLVCEAAQLKDKKNIFAAAATGRDCVKGRSLSVLTACKDGRLSAGTHSHETTMKQSSTEQRMAQPDRPDEGIPISSPPSKHEMHIGQKAPPIRAIWQELERLHREHVTLVQSLSNSGLDVNDPNSTDTVRKLDTRVYELEISNESAKGVMVQLMNREEEHISCTKEK